MPLELALDPDEPDPDEVDVAAGVEEPCVELLLELDPQAATPRAASTSRTAVHIRGDRVVVVFMVAPVFVVGTENPDYLLDAGSGIVVPLSTEHLRRGATRRQTYYQGLPNLSPNFLPDPSRAGKESSRSASVDSRYRPR
jgi:hypothetical protein